MELRSSIDFLLFFLSVCAGKRQKALFERKMYLIYRENIGEADRHGDGAFIEEFSFFEDCQCSGKNL